MPTESVTLIIYRPPHYIWCTTNLEISLAPGVGQMPYCVHTAGMPLCLNLRSVQCGAQLTQFTAREVKVLYTIISKKCHATWPCLRAKYEIYDWIIKLQTTICIYIILLTNNQIAFHEKIIMQYNSCCTRHDQRCLSNLFSLLSFGNIRGSLHPLPDY